MKLTIFKNESSNGYHLILNPQLEGELEAKKLLEVVKYLKDQFQLETEINMLEFGMPPYLKFKEKNGISITIALDDFDGLSIESNSKTFLETLKSLLEQNVFYS